MRHIRWAEIDSFDLRSLAANRQRISLSGRSKMRQLLKTCTGRGALAYYMVLELETVYHVSVREVKVYVRT